jgi:preprotein translocase subunit SecB
MENAEALTYTLDVEIRAEQGEADEIGAEYWTAYLDAAVSWSGKEGDSHPIPPFDIKVQLVGIFEWYEERWPQEEVQEWIRYNAETLMWPYLRAYIQQTTAASDVPQLTIYTLGVIRPRIDLADAEPMSIEAPAAAEDIGV